MIFVRTATVLSLVRVTSSIRMGSPWIVGLTRSVVIKVPAIQGAKNDNDEDRQGETLNLLKRQQQLSARLSGRWRLLAQRGRNQPCDPAVFFRS
jgi:hypothetical protein